VVCFSTTSLRFLGSLAGRETVRSFFDELQKIGCRPLCRYSRAPSQRKHGRRYRTVRGLSMSLTTQNAVYVSTRDAKAELGRHSNLHSVRLWFRELQHYGFIVMVSPAHHGVNGHGKAPHWRLTEVWYLGKERTRDFIRWDGSPFTEKRNRSRGRDGGYSVTHTGAPYPSPRVTHTGVVNHWLCRV
jgi:hypothetical protein